MDAGVSGVYAALNLETPHWFKDLAEATGPQTVRRRT